METKRRLNQREVTYASRLQQRRKFAEQRKEQGTFGKAFAKQNTIRKESAE